MKIEWNKKFRINLNLNTKSNLIERSTLISNLKLKSKQNLLETNRKLRTELYIINVKLDLKIEPNLITK